LFCIFTLPSVAGMFIKNKMKQA